MHLISLLPNIILFFSIGFIVGFIFEKTTKKWSLWDKKIGWQIHHSIFGLISVFLAILIKKYQIEFFSIGTGIILQHTYSDGFVFIKRW